MGDTSKTDAPRAQPLSAPPKQVLEYAQTCVQYVKKNMGVPLDFRIETLPILDHYLRQARSAKAERPEAGILIATVAGCYLGEVIRGRHAVDWDLCSDDPLRWKIVDPSGALTVFPVALVQVAIEGLRSERELEFFSFESKLNRALVARLDRLPQVDEEEYIAPSTRVEVIDIAFELLAGLKRKSARRDCCDGDGDCHH